MKRKIIKLTVLISILLGITACGMKPVPTQAEIASEPTTTVVSPTTRPDIFTREQLIHDARQLADIIEDTHPDPYIRGAAELPSIAGCSVSSKPFLQKG